SAREIARTGGVNQALVFYHFGSVNELLLAALDRTSELRMERYRTMLDDAKDLPALLAAAAAMYREDLDAGHIKVMAEMIAGASSDPDLGPEIVRRIEPWIAFARGGRRLRRRGAVPRGGAAHEPRRRSLAVGSPLRHRRTTGRDVRADARDA